MDVSFSVLEYGYKYVSIAISNEHRFVNDKKNQSKWDDERKKLK